MFNCNTLNKEDLKSVDSENLSTYCRKHSSQSIQQKQELPMVTMFFVQSG